ncbi:MAG: helix-turn-helix domain-containing protein [Microcella sp.]|uniref:IclR family transcriptional regulator n=1 Tax=Microcella sp. TaxID=1913979 RepID=UPI003315BEAE
MTAQSQPPRDPGSRATSTPQPDYAVPALDKALDILELLADEPGGLSQSEIADATGRSVGQIYRVLVSLERRGYLVRERAGRYLLGTRLFDLAHRHAPVRGLEAAALPIMRELAESVRQSCNLAVLEGDRVRVVAQVESPADFGYRVRVGALFDVAGTATGDVLAGNGDELVRADALQPGITDVVAAVRGAAGATIAALTVPYVSTSFSTVAHTQVVQRARSAAYEISQALGWRAGVTGG